MRIFVAGSFGGANLRKQLYASGAKHVLSSNAWPNARETAEIIAKGEEVKLFLAALGNGDDNWAMAISARLHNLLCSFGHNTSRMTADYFAPRDREEDMKLFTAGMPSGGTVNRTRIDESLARHILCSFGWQETRVTAEYIAKKDPMKLFIAGELTPPMIEEICHDTGEKNLLCTNAGKQSRDRADYFAHAGAPLEQQVKLFIAGDRGDEKIQEAEFEESGARNLLYSNASDQARGRAEVFSTKLASDFTRYHLLIDSGAFTAFKQGTPIDLADYIAYAKDLQAKAYCDVEFIALDVITPAGESKETLEKNCQKGYDNWKEMQAAGVPCIPTFHRGDHLVLGGTEAEPNWKWLDVFARELPAGSRFCIAPKVDGTRKDVKMHWLNQVFQRLEEINAELNAKEGTAHKLWERWLIHGLGISSQEMMEAYPWYSVDSTGWLSAAQNCNYRFFDGKQIQILQSNNDYLEGGRSTANSKNALDHYRIARGHKYVHTHFGCEKCGLPEEGHKEAQPDAEGLDAGAYWFGKEAIRADVELAQHVTKVWQARGVLFPGEEKLDTTGFSTDSHWQAYRDGEQKYHPDHGTFDDMWL